MNGVVVDDTMSPTERFNAISRSMGGKEIKYSPGAQVDPYMQAWANRPGPAQATQTFLQMNEERIARGEPPLNSRMEPIVEGPPTTMGVVERQHFQTPLPTAAPDDFFSEVKK